MILSFRTDIPGQDPLIQTLPTPRCLQSRNARFCNVLFDVTSYYFFGWNIFHLLSYEQNLLTNKIAGKLMNIKKIKLYKNVNIQNIFYEKLYMKSQVL